MQKPNLFEYLDVSLYLKDLYKFRKFKENLFSYDTWTQEIGLKSRAHLRSIVIGQIGLSENLLTDFINGLKLTSAEAEYFIILTKYSTAPSKQLKEVYGKTLLMLWKVKIQEVDIPDIANFLSDSIIPVVFTFLSFEDATSNLEEIAHEIGCEPSRLQKALRILVWQKLIDGAVDADGKISYRTVKPFFRIPTLPNNNYLKDFHINGLRLAEEANNYPADQRKFYCSFVALSPEQFNQAQTMIQDFSDRILSVFQNTKLDNRKIYRMNIQVFPVSKTEQVSHVEVVDLD